MSQPLSIQTGLADGAQSITVGGTAQNLYGGLIPVNGFAVYNVDVANDLWISLYGTAAPNASGSIRVAANGGAYESPLWLKPSQAISIYGSTTGQQFTAVRA